MSKIEKGNEILTLINVFSVAPEKQQELVTLLVNATEQTMKGIPGFISANIHRSLDGKKVVNDAQWASKGAFQAMLQHPDAQVHMQASAALATFEPILCEVSEALSMATHGANA